jgi:Swt1-like HEPN
LHSEDGLFEILVHVAHDSLGPSSPEQRALLTQYGLIVPSPDGRMRIFSEHFREFLQSYRPIVSTFDLVRRTEVTIRGFIERTAQKQYGPAWLQRIAKRNPGLSDRKDEWEKMSNKDKARYGAAAPLLSYSFTKDLWEIMSMEWEMFQPFLGRNKKYWDDRFDALVKVRNAVAHHYEEILPAEVLEMAERYCDELRQSIEREPTPQNVRIMQFPSA